jgi:hypothetical protein
MATFAVLNSDNDVINVIVADSVEDAESVTEKTCIPCSGTEVLGNNWNGSEFIARVIVTDEE